MQVMQMARQDYEGMTCNDLCFLKTKHTKKEELDDELHISDCNC
jgi:hypothetical protein